MGARSEETLKIEIFVETLLRAAAPNSLTSTALVNQLRRTTVGYLSGIQLDRVNPILNRLHRAGVVSKVKDPAKRSVDWTWGSGSSAPILPAPAALQIVPPPRILPPANAAQARSAEELSMWDYATLTPLEEIAADDTRYSKEAAANRLRVRVVEIVRRYGPISTSDVARKESGDHVASHNYTRVYATLKALQKQGAVWRDTSPQSMRCWHHPVDVHDRVALEEWLDAR